MRKIIAALAVSALAITAGGSVATAKERKTGEQKLAEMLKGRVAGKPVNCINTWRNDDMSIIDGTAIVYRSGRTIYVNRTQNPESLDWNDILVIEHQTGNELCKLDHVTTIDRGSGFLSGVVFLTDFVPYTLPKDAPASEAG
jgi:hypothetical protein